MTSTTKPEPSWRDVKAELEGFDRAGLLRLLKISTRSAGTTKHFSTLALASARLHWSPTKG